MRPRERGAACVPAWLATLGLLAACGGEGDGAQSSGAVGARAPLQAGTLLHLADALEQAEIHSAPAPAAAQAERSWSFAEARPEWRALAHADNDWLANLALQPRPDSLRLTISPAGEGGFPMMSAGLVVQLEPTPLEQWSGVLVRARSSARFSGMALAHNVEERDALPHPFFFLGGNAGAAPIFNDGSTQTYHLPLRPRGEGESLRSLALLIGATDAGSLDLFALTLVPRGADFLAERGVRAVTREEVTRHSVFTHTPATLTWRLRVPERGRLDFGLTCLPGESVVYRAKVRAGTEERVLLEQEVSEHQRWHQVALDLAEFSAREVELTLSAEGAAAGSVALWGAPLVSSAPPRPATESASARRRPNIVFYVIDGAGADLMSAFGYNRRTTPFLESLAAEGVLFERAYSNSTWTQASTASFMTGLHHSVLGGLRRGIHSTPVPAAAVTMAEHMRRGGYLTACFTANPNAGRVIGLERGIDYLNDAEPEHASTSSSELHERFFRLRDEVPAEPYWVHFQTTDVHEPNEPVPPFAGLFVSKDERLRLGEWDERLFTQGGDLFGTTSVADFYERALARAEVDRQSYYNTRRGLYDETMAYQDRELGRFVQRLKERGEWENTLLVIGSDHGHPAGTFARFGRGLFEPQPPGWEGALFDSYATHIPLLFVWSGQIAGGRRCSEPVSMIDVLPTLLELAELPPPEVLQGRSLAPYLRGGPLGPHEVVFDEFRVDEATGEMVGNLEILDGRWGASLEVGPQAAGADPTRGRHASPAGGRWGAVHPYFADQPRLLLYDLWNDPFALHAVNAEHADLVEHYRKLLLERWEAHRALATRFQEGESAALDPAQLEQLRALGYIR